MSMCSSSDSRPSRLMLVRNDYKVAVLVTENSTFYYYESTKRKIKTKNICGCRCYERLQPNTRNLHVSHTYIVMFIMNQ